MSPERTKTPAIALTFLFEKDADDGEFALHLFDQRRRPLQLAAPGAFLQLLAVAGEEYRAHVAAASLEAVRGMPQSLGIAGLEGGMQAAQALLGVEHEGIQQDRIFVLHDLLQRSQNTIIEMRRGHSIAP